MLAYRSAVALEDFHPETAAYFKNRRVLVLGGSGFIGSHVVEQLQTLGAEPVVLSRQANPAFLTHLPGLKVVVGSLDNRESVDAAIAGCSVVLNLAASVAGIEYNATHSATMFMDNMELFFLAIRAAVRARVERFLVTSSACVYPRYCTIPTPEREGFLESPEPTNVGYGWAKRMEEFVGASAVREYGLEVAIARPYNAYGPRDNFSVEKSHVVAALVRKAVESRNGTFPVWGDGSHSRGFLYVDDFARGLIEVVARFPNAEPINIGAHEETTIREAAETVADEVSKLTGRAVKPTFDPKGLTGQPRRACDTTMAREILGYQAKVSFREGARRTVQWYLQQ